MDFSVEFLDEILEAYEYWASKQADLPETMTISKWATSLLAQPVYQHLAAKRVENG